MASRRGVALRFGRAARPSRWAAGVNPLWLAAGVAWVSGWVLGRAAADAGLYGWVLCALCGWCAAACVAQRRHRGWLVMALGAVAWSYAGMSWVTQAVRPDSEARLFWQCLTLVGVALHRAACLLLPWWWAGWAGRPGATTQPAFVAWRWCVAMVVAEVLLQLGWFGHGYASLAVTLVRWPAAAHVLPAGGALGLVVLACGLCAAAAVPVLYVVSRAAHGADRERTVWSGFGLVWLVLALGAGGLAAWLMARPLAAGSAPPPTQVTVLLPGPSPFAEWTPEVRESTVAALERAMLAAPVGGVVATPETYFAAAPPVWAQGRWGDVLALARRRGQTLLLGMPNQYADAQGVHNVNSVTQVSPDRVSVYGKERMVPFAEYLPWPELLGWVYRTVFASAHGGMGPAPAALARPLYVQGQQVGVFICHEQAFALTVAERARDADWLLSVSDDGWVGGSAYLGQMLAIARLRAMETGKYLLRAVSGGDSYLLSPQGQVLTSASHSQAGAWSVQVPAVSTTTPFVAYAVPLTLAWVAGLVLSGCGFRFLGSL